VIITAGVRHAKIVHAAEPDLRFKP